MNHFWKKIYEIEYFRGDLCEGEIKMEIWAFEPSLRPASFRMGRGFSDRNKNEDKDMDDQYPHNQE